MMARAVSCCASFTRLLGRRPGARACVGVRKLPIDDQIRVCCDCQLSWVVAKSKGIQFPGAVMKPFIMLAVIPAIATAQSAQQYRGPIIDVHLHAHTRESLAQPLPNPATGQLSPKTAQEHMTRSLDIMKERNVVLGIVSGSSVAAVEPWKAAAPDRIMKGISVDDPSQFMKPEELDRLFREKR